MKEASKLRKRPPGLGGQVARLREKNSDSALEGLSDRSCIKTCRGQTLVSLIKCGDPQGFYGDL